MGLVSKIEQSITENQLVQRGETLVVAVSGGPDSIALLHVLFLLSNEWDVKLVAAHVNHQFRGEESDAEAEFVASFAAKLGLPCEVGVINVPEYIEQTSMNGQAAARKKRYEFLHLIASRYRAQRIALAHHADDQAETMIMRLLRGTGPSGLAGMPIKRVEKKTELIRPFLRIYKSEVISHCREYGLAYCQDSSNVLRKYFRNQIRLDVIPMLQQYNRHLPETLNRLAELMRGEDDYMEREAARIFASMVRAENSACSLSRNDFMHLHVALQRRLIKLILTYLALQGDSFDFARMEMIRTAILQENTSNLRLDIQEHLCFVREYEQLRFLRATPVSSPFCYTLSDLQGDLTIPEAGASFRCSVLLNEGDDRAFVDRKLIHKKEALFDLDQVKLPLHVRSRSDGDRIDLLGLNGSKKVKDIFIDAKIPPSQRDRIPLVVDAAQRVLWIPGIRRSKYALLNSRTTRLLHLSFVHA